MPLATEKLSQKFLDSYNFLLLQSKISGLVTFNIKTMKPSKLLSFFNILRCVVFVALITFYTYDAANQDIHLVIRTTNIISTVMTGVYLISTWVCAILKASLVIVFLKKIIEIDTNLETMNITIDYKESQRKILLQSVIRFSCLVGIVAALVHAIMRKNKNILIELLDFVLLLIINSVVCQEAGQCVLMLKTRFEILNQKIHLIKNEPEHIRLISNLHHELSKLVVLFNDIFGLVLLLMFAISLVNIVLSNFYLIACLQSSKIIILNIVEPIVSQAPFTFNVVYICRVCQKTIDEANKTGELIHRIHRDDVENDIEMFSLQIAHDQVDFTAANFFPINHSLMFSFIGGVTTYIIILLQLAVSLAD